MEISRQRLLGEDWLGDEYHGIDTCNQIDVDGVEIQFPPHALVIELVILPLKLYLGSP